MNQSPQSFEFNQAPPAFEVPVESRDVTIDMLAHAAMSVGAMIDHYRSENS